MAAWEPELVLGIMSLHDYSTTCGCAMCARETSLQKSTWAEAQALCIHRKTNEPPCEICIDVASGANNEDPVLHALGVMVAGSLRRNFT